MFRFGFSRISRDTPAIASRELIYPVHNAPPSAGEVVFEIGLVLALHLAFALAVLVTLDAAGVT